MKTTIVRFAAFIAVVSLHAQAPVGSLGGTITDPSGGIVKGAKVTVTDLQRATRRDLSTNSVGAFSAPSLIAGEYEVRVEAPGFRTTVRNATVDIGKNTTVDLALEVGATKDVIN